MGKIYLFVLSPPFQGSTILLKLLNTSPNISTLLGNHNWVGEGQQIFKKKIPSYWSNRWNPDYKLNMSKVSRIFHRHWDQTKLIMCDKSPPTIARARRFYNHFSKKGQVYFISLIRDPYCVRDSAKRWLKYARFQRENIRRYQMKMPDNPKLLSLTYEELCDDLEGTIQKIQKFLPALGTLDPNVSAVPGIQSKKRSQKIQNMNRPRDVKARRKILATRPRLVKFFKYQI